MVKIAFVEGSKGIKLGKRGDPDYGEGRGKRRGEKRSWLLSSCGGKKKRSKQNPQGSVGLLPRERRREGETSAL